MTARLDITGRRFGRLTVLGFSHVDKQSHWACRCDCGTEFTVRGSSLTSGNTTQCVGCQALAQRGNQRAKKHGHTSGSGVKQASPTYESWKAMWARVTNPNNASWEHYGAKGVKAYEGWRDFEAFLIHHGERPPGTTLDRFPDKTGNYVPGNTRWATPQQQRDNQNEPRKRRPEDLAGQKFGRLMAIRLSHVRNGHAYFLCLCDCGNEKVAPSHNLKRGRVASCGCLRHG